MDLSPEEILEEGGFEIKDLNEAGTILLRDFDYASAIIGVTNDDRVVYDYNKMIEYLILKEDMSMEEAVEWIDFNTLRAVPYMGTMAPIILYPLYNAE